MKQKILLSAFLLLIPVLAAAQTHTLTLQEAIEIALENNYQLKQAQHNLDFAGTNVFSAKAEFLPSLNASLSANRNTGRDFIPEELVFENRTRHGMSGFLNTNITIFDGFSNIASLRAAQADQLSQEEQFKRLRENVIFNTAGSYLQVVLNDELLSIAESALEASSSQLERIEAQVEVGSLPTVDLYNQEAQVANDELAVIQAENALAFSKAQLIRIMQDETIEDVELIIPSAEDLDLMPGTVNLQELIAAALETRSDLAAQRLAIESNEQNLRIARGNLLPSLTASASISGNYSDQDRNPITGEIRTFTDQFFESSVRRSIGLSLQIPIFNRWNNRVSIESAQVQLKNSRLELDNIRFQISEEIRQAYNDYLSVSKQLESTEKALIAAERAYETELQRYEVGSTTLIELNQANANYVQAQSNRLQAVYNFVFQQRLLDYYIGELDENTQFNF